MKQILLAFQFLTIIPFKKNIAFSETDVARSSSAFVIVGFIQGILLLMTDYIAGIFFQPELVVLIILLVLVISNGGFHLDGLADTFDAIAVKSTGNREQDIQKRLSIMKDSTTGPAGVTAIIFVLGTKYLSLKNLSYFPLSIYYSSLLLMPVLSKWTLVLSMFYGKSSRNDGLGKIFINRTGVKEILTSTLFLILLIILIPLVFRFNPSKSQYFFYVILLIILYFFCHVCIRFFDKKFRGLSGDTLGAISELTEIIFLLMVLMWSHISIE